MFGSSGREDVSNRSLLPRFRPVNFPGRRFCNDTRIATPTSHYFPLVGGSGQRSYLPLHLCIQLHVKPLYCCDDLAACACYQPRWGDSAAIDTFGSIVALINC